MLVDSRTAILCVLEEIPSHRQQRRSPDDIAAVVSSKLRISTDAAISATQIVLGFLETFGVLEWEDSSCRFADQIQDYFRHSLHWYITNRQKLLANWDRTGTAREIKAVNLLETGPQFLKIMEQKRIEVSRQNKIDPGYSRLQSIAIVIIRGVDRSKSYFLHQWDSHAEQYQLIGGRQRPGESIVETAKRELQEELGQQDWVYGRDYDLTQLTDQPVAMLALSRTYGALTRYEHWPFHARLMVDSLHLSEIDKWIESDEMRRGVTKTGKRVSSPEQYRLLDAVIPSGLEALHESIKIKQTANWWEYIEIKPNILGLVSVDLKGLAQEWLRKFRGKP